MSSEHYGGQHDPPPSAKSARRILSRFHLWRSSNTAPQKYRSKKTQHCSWNTLLAKWLTLRYSGWGNSEYLDRFLATLSARMRQGVGELMRDFREYSRRERYSSNKRSIAIGGRQTSVNLEEPFWQGLKEIAEIRAIRLADLITEIDKDRRFANLSSTIRLFVLEHYYTLARQKQSDHAEVTGKKRGRTALSIPPTQPHGRESWAPD